MKVLMNAELVDRENAVVDIEDRGYQFGDGIYEAIRVYKQKMFTFDEHIARLWRSAEKLEMQLPYSPEKLRSLLQSLLEANEIETGALYLQFTRGVQRPRGHVYLPTARCTLTTMAQQAPRWLDNFENGIAAITAEDDRWLHCDIKTLNLLGNIMAATRASRAGAQEAIFHRGSMVTECSHSNVHTIKEGVLHTHPASNLILNGITRQVIISIAKNKGIPVKEEAFTVEELKNADEVFISSIMAEATPVVTIDGTPVANGKRGPLTAQLQQCFKQEIERRCEIALD
ncbi:MAG: D-amino-acid transaminase [Oscillospiraceae bacterium]